MSALVYGVAALYGVNFVVQAMFTVKLGAMLGHELRGLAVSMTIGGLMLVPLVHRSPSQRVRQLGSSAEDAPLWIWPCALAGACSLILAVFTLTALGVTNFVLCFACGRFAVLALLRHVGGFDFVKVEPHFLHGVGLLLLVGAAGVMLALSTWLDNFSAGDFVKYVVLAVIGGGMSTLQDAVSSGLLLFLSTPARARATSAYLGALVVVVASLFTLVPSSLEDNSMSDLDWGYISAGLFYGLGLLVFIFVDDTAEGYFATVDLATQLCSALLLEGLADFGLGDEPVSLVRACLCGVAVLGGACIQATPTSSEDSFFVGSYSLGSTSVELKPKHNREISSSSSPGGVPLVGSPDPYVQQKPRTSVSSVGELERTASSGSFRGVVAALPESELEAYTPVGSLTVVVPTRGAGGQMDEQRVVVTAQVQPPLSKHAHFKDPAESSNNSSAIPSPPSSDLFSSPVRNRGAWSPSVSLTFERELPIILVDAATGEQTALGCVDYIKDELLLHLRKRIVDELDHVPTFVFLRNRVPVGKRQEHKKPVEYLRRSGVAIFVQQDTVPDYLDSSGASAANTPDRSPRRRRPKHRSKGASPRSSSTPPAAAVSRGSYRRLKSTGAKSRSRRVPRAGKKSHVQLVSSPQG